MPKPCRLQDDVMSLVRFKQTCFCLRLSCLPSFTPNTKCLLSDVLSMLTGFLPHGDAIQYYLCLRSCYSQFLGIWRIADEGHQPHAASRHDVERGRSTTIGNSTEPSAINPDQHLWNPQDCLNFKQTPCSIWPGRRNEDKLRPQPSTQINTSGIHRTTATPEPMTTTKKR